MSTTHVRPRKPLLTAHRKDLKEKPSSVTSMESKLHAALRRILLEAKSDVGKIVAVRSLEAVADFLMQANAGRLREVATARNNYDVLLEQLSAPSFIKTVDPSDPLFRARLRGLSAKKELITAGGGVLSVEEAASILGLTRQAVDLRRKKRQLLGLDLGRRGFGYPLWQFDEKVKDALPEVLGRLHSEAGQWEVMGFFLNKNAYLDGKRPIDELHAGRKEGVLRAAEAYMTQGEP